MDRYLLSRIILLTALTGLAACRSSVPVCRTQPTKSDLTFAKLASSWDESIPLGNATVGALIWQKGNNLRFSLDRTDLWDLRPSDSLRGEEFRFAWVKEHIQTANYYPVQRRFDKPYDRNAAPSKIPGAAVEFPLEALGTPEHVRLFLNNALCEITWPNGTRLQTFAHASEPVGWFVFTGLSADVEPQLAVPTYHTEREVGETNPVDGQSLERLGYKQGTVNRAPQLLTYHQPGYGDFAYDVAVRWAKQDRTLYGTWSITSSLTQEQAAQATHEALQRGLAADYRAHTGYWRGYWNQASVSLPDTVLQKQYDNEMYKFASAARENSYPISLQAVWTADNGRLPPWKGDYHHDLNTQLSYWPAYTGNRLSEGLGYLNTLWEQRDAYRTYTRQYFETDGFNVPGVCALNGEPMGGWIQYALSQTAGAWLAQHFYLHWKYSADRIFLQERAYPFLKEVATYMEQQSTIDEHGVRKLAYMSCSCKATPASSVCFPPCPLIGQTSPSRIFAP